MDILITTLPPKNLQHVEMWSVDPIHFISIPKFQHVLSVMQGQIQQERSVREKVDFDH